MNVVIFKVNQLGDNVVFLPVVQHLRKALPEVQLTVLTSPVARPLYDANCAGVDALTFLTAQFNGSWRHPWRLLQLLSIIRAKKPDVCLLADDQGNAAHLLARLSGARLTVGARMKHRHGNCLLHERVPICLQDSEALRNWHVMRHLLHCLGRPDPGLSQPQQPDLSAMTRGFEQHNAIVIHAGASRAYKRWPLERFTALADRLAALNHPVLWVEQDELPGDSLSAAVQRVRPDSLEGFVRLMAGARLFIGNNSGPMNIASALGIPGVIFNGPSTPNWDPAWHKELFLILRDPALPCQPCDLPTHPVNACQNRADPMICMRRWEVEAVTELVQQHLKFVS